jgi:hypothetical protein
MVTAIFSSLPGKRNFTIEKGDVSSNSHSFSLRNNICVSYHQQRKKIQDYSRFRCADSERINNSSSTSFLFIKKQTNILAQHPGRFYIQQKTDMNKQSNIQEYCRYRDSQYHSPRKVIKMIILRKIYFVF